MLRFPVAIKAGLPIYEQVVFAVKKAIISGQLKPGDMFPSVRELSRELKINPNTAQKIVAQLVQSRLLEIKPGIGSVVTGIPEATDEQRQKILQTTVESLVVEAKRLGIKKKELLESIQKHWELTSEDKK